MSWSFWICTVFGWLSIGTLNVVVAQDEHLQPTSPPSSIPAPPPHPPAEPHSPHESHPPMPPPPHSSSNSKPEGRYTGSDDEGMKTEHIFAMVLPMVIFTLLIVFAAIGIYYMMRRARYGAFCCLNPHLNYRLQPSEPKDESTDRELSDLAAPRSGTPPPDYTPSRVGPPVYQDALQDVIVQTDDMYSFDIPPVGTTRPSGNTSTDDVRSTDTLLVTSFQPVSDGDQEAQSS